MAKEGGGDITWRDLGLGQNGEETGGKKAGKKQIKGSRSRQVSEKAVRVALGLKEGRDGC